MVKKYIYLAIIILLLVGMMAYKVYASSVGPNGPSTSGNDATVGTTDWNTIGNIFASDASYATTTTWTTCPKDIVENSVKIIKGGAITGTDQSTGATLPTTEAYITYGGVSSLWGTTWTSTDINASNFGVGFSVKDTGTNVTHYLTATNFGFSIPAGATITGIQVDIQENSVLSGPVCP